MKKIARGRSEEALLRAGSMVASLLAILGVVTVLEAAVRIADPQLMVRHRGMQRYHPRLGWENRPGGHSVAGGVKVSVDEHGRRFVGAAPGLSHGSPTPLILLGDSVTFGLGVSDDETFAASLSQGSAPYHVTNLAVPGYGPGQSALRFESERPFSRPAVVILGLCLGNDLADVVSRHHLYDERLPKPRFVLRGGALRLEDEHVGGQRLRSLLDRSFLLARLGPSVEAPGPQHEQTARRLDALRRHSPEAEDTLVAIVERLRGQVESRGARLLVVAFPDFRTLDPKSVRWPRLQKKLAPHIDLLDLTRVLAPDQETYARNSLDHIGHLSRHGHEHAARAVRGRLARLGN